jgi:hypothetical protein
MIESKQDVVLHPGKAILLNGVVHTANREIGVPGLQVSILRICGKNG